MMNKKLGLVVTMVMTMSIVLAGCFNSATQPTEVPDETLVPAVTAEVTLAPNSDMLPEETNAPGAAVAPFDWMQQGNAVTGRINLFSEIAESVIVTSEQTALVGVNFTSTYKGQMTQRIKDMIAGEVMAADTAITVVAVTADPADYAKIQALAQRKQEGATDAEIKPEVDQIVKNIGTMR